MNTVLNKYRVLNLIAVAFLWAFRWAPCWLAISAVSAMSSAPARAAEDVTEIDHAMADLYCQFDGQPPQVTEAACPPGTFKVPAEQRARWALTIFDDQIAGLDTSQYNKLLARLGADYRHHPEHREAIELLLASVDVQVSAGIKTYDDHASDAVRERLRLELQRAGTREPVIIDVMDGILTTYFVATVFEFGRGAPVAYRELRWFWSGGLSIADLLYESGAAFVEVQSAARKAAWARKLPIGAVGAAAGLTRAALRTFEKYKIPPQELLDTAQADIVREARSTADQLDEQLNDIARVDDALLTLSATETLARVTELSKAGTTLKAELERLSAVAPTLRSQITEIKTDLDTLAESAQVVTSRITAALKAAQRARKRPSH